MNLDALIDQTLTARAIPTANTGLEARLLQRLTTPAALQNSSQTAASGSNVLLFSAANRMSAPRSRTSAWTAIGLHAAAIALIAFGLATHTTLVAKKQTLTATLLAPPPPPVAPRTDAIGGGGGHHDLSPVTAGRLPKYSTEQLTPPKAPPTEAPKLSLEPTVVMQKDLKMANNDMPNFGAPNSTLKGFSLGDGSGTGIGSGNGTGIGPGSGGNIGGGVMHVGGSVKAPVVLYSIDPEFSEAARKAKFSGNVLVNLVIDKQGKPQHVRCARDIGMGLCEKAVEAVEQYKFKPATQNGEPVAVDMNVEVGFQIF